MREIAGPNRGFGITCTQVAIDDDLGILETPKRLFFVEADGEAFPAYRKAHEVDVDVFLRKSGTRTPERTRHATPIGVVAGDAGLNER